MKLAIDIFQLVANVATTIAVILAIYTLKENIVSRKTSIKPVLFPSRIKELVSDDNLFACNYEYPVVDNIGTPTLVYFGVKNIGKGPAKNVRVISFKSEEESPIIFRVGYNSVHIPEGASIPFVIRVAREDFTYNDSVTYSATIQYEDLFGSKFYISIRIWIRESEAVVIEYSAQAKPKWRKIIDNVSREMEANGYFEMRRLEKEIKKNSNFKWKDK
jgi:hypothetical protein